MKKDIRAYTYEQLARRLVEKNTKEIKKKS